MRLRVKHLFAGFAGSRGPIGAVTMAGNGEMGSEQEDPRAIRSGHDPGEITVFLQGEECGAG